MMHRLGKIVFGPNHRWWALGVAALATFMVTTDAGLLSISLPVIVAEFKTDLATGGWLPFIYALVTGSLYLPCGRLSDLFGRKRTLSIGFLLYTSTSLMAGFSQSMAQVIFFRGLQAAGSALMMANTFALVTELFSPAERGRAMGLSGGMISALGFVVGPALGGLITYTLGWRSVFYVSCCLGVVGFAGARLILFDDSDAVHAEKKEPFDFIGTATFAFGLTMLLLALTAGQKGLWDAPLVLAGFALAALSLAGFIVWEARTRYPLLDLGLFRIRLFTAGNIARLSSFVTISMNQLLMPFFLQLGLGLDTLRAGDRLSLGPDGRAAALVAGSRGHGGRFFFASKARSRLVADRYRAAAGFDGRGAGSFPDAQQQRAHELDPARTTRRRLVVSFDRAQPRALDRRRNGERDRERAARRRHRTDFAGCAEDRRHRGKKRSAADGISSGVPLRLLDGGCHLSRRRRGRGDPER
jgi:MFS family permease